MFEALKDELNLKKGLLLYRKYEEEGLIADFEDDLWDRLEKNCGIGVPVAWRLNYFNSIPGLPSDNCDDRALLITLGFDDAVLVMGDIRGVTFAYEDTKHYWVEHDGYVYAPMSLKKYRKDIFYKLHQPKNVVEITKEEYMTDDYIDIKNTTIEDFRTDPDKRLRMFLMVPEVSRSMGSNKTSRALLDNYLEEVDYYNKWPLNEIEQTLEDDKSFRK